jgi:glyoxylase-like metal-dependent hydrolase (beta-lactamase superfamily II)
MGTYPNGYISDVGGIAMKERILGGVRIQRILELEGPFVEPDQMFAEATSENLAPHRHWLEPKALCPRTGKLILPIQSYLVRTHRHTILVDTCIGNDKTVDWHEPWNKRRNETWMLNLGAAGVHPEEIDFVLCTHLHVDHCGWNTRRDKQQWVPTFPRAKYIFSRREYEAAQSLGGSVFEENVVPVMEAGQAILVDMDYALDDEVWFEPTPGHTLGHVAIRLASGGNRAVISGDVIHSPIQCVHPEWNFIYDHDQDLARKTRRAFLATHCDTDTLVFTAHFPSPSVGHVIADGGAFGFRYA